MHKAAIQTRSDTLNIELPYALKGINVYKLETEHGKIFSPPFDQKIGIILQEQLDKALKEI